LEVLLNASKRWTIRALALSLALTLTHCSSRTESSSSARDSTGGGVVSSGAALTGAGATFPYPLYSKWFDVYREKTGVAINYQSIGSGAGIQQMRAQTVDFGASDAPLADSALAAMPRHVVHVPTVGGAVVLATNLPGLTQTLRLTPAVLAAIELGQIKVWNDPLLAEINPGVALPAMPVLAVHRSDGSGTTNIFTTYLSRVSPAWAKRVGAGTAVSWPVGVGGKGNDGVAGLIQQTPGAIGYVELAYARQNKLPMAALRNRAGRFVEPSLESTSAAIAASSAALARDVRTPIVDAPGEGSYPIAALTFLLLFEQSADAGKGAQLLDFVAWAIHDGQAFAASLGYAPLPPAIVQVNEATLARLKSGHATSLNSAPRDRRSRALVPEVAS
jgi:phosphate transport system substrate-binding protein